MKMCAQRKAGRRQRASLPSVPFLWSLAVHVTRFALASAMRKTKRLRRRLVRNSMRLQINIERGRIMEFQWRLGRVRGCTQLIEASKRPRCYTFCCSKLQLCRLLNSSFSVESQRVRYCWLLHFASYGLQDSNVQGLAKLMPKTHGIVDKQQTVISTHQ